MITDRFNGYNCANIGTVITVMGRGLSPLQKRILELAYKNRMDYNDGKIKHSPGVDFTDLNYKDVMTDYYGFKQNGAHYGQVFSMAEIGEKRYRAANVAISRAVTRLGKRGLVIPMCGACARWSGCNLTDEGLELAKTILPSSTETLLNSKISD
jgi:protein-disulfide isomerase-like protein with CxxC motif